MAKLRGGTLSIDIGGSGIKGMVLDPDGQPMGEKTRIETPRPANPRAVLDTIEALAATQPAFERVAAGFPGVVIDGVVQTAPNLDGKWRKVALAEQIEARLGRPARVANDADVQGYGVIEGNGVEMVITLGTGLGSAIFVNGHLVPNLELGHHPFRKGRTYEECLGEAARKRAGSKAWSKRVRDAIDQIIPIWNPSVLYLGGGNASPSKLKLKLPRRVRRVENVAGILGGIKLWTVG